MRTHQVIHNYQYFLLLSQYCFLVYKHYCQCKQYTYIIIPSVCVQESSDNHVSWSLKGHASHYKHFLSCFWVVR